MTEHSVEIEVSRDGAWPRFQCTAKDDDDVQTSPCRWYCTRSSCEEGCMCSPGDRSSWTQHLDYCRMIEGWFDDEPWERYDGEPTVARSGPVYLAWDGDTYVWGYLPGPVASESDQ